MMSFSIGIVLALLFVGSQAVDISRFTFAPGVEPALAPYLEQLYERCENPTATTSYTDFFAPSGRFSLLGITSVGTEAVLALKRFIVPPTGALHENHIPLYAEVLSETDTHKVYHVSGAIELHPKGLNCSKSFYETRFTIAKDFLGAVPLRPHSMDIIHWDDYSMNPEQVPTNIPCGGDDNAPGM